MVAYPVSRRGGRRDHVDAAPGPEVPEAHRLVLGRADKHGAAPRVQRQNVTRVPRERLEWGAGGAIRHVYLAVAGAAADEQTRLVARVLDEAQVTHCPVVHRQFDFLT